MQDASVAMPGGLFCSPSLPASPWWLPGGNAQTIWSALYAQRFQGDTPAFSRTRWNTPDGDFVDVDRLVEPADCVTARAPLLVLFHGLEGSSSSHYVQAFADVARQRGWGLSVPHFRGCSGEINLAPRAYHSGDHAEIDWMLARFRVENPGRPVLAAGVSLGGNALLRWAAEHGTRSAEKVAALAAISAPLDLAAAGESIDQGFNRWVYARMFLKTMVRKAEAKWRQFPGLFDLDLVRDARTLYAFDNVFTAPLHGFKDTEDYWSRAASKPRLGDVRVPALVVNALNDPFVPSWSLPKGPPAGGYVSLWQPAQGGHVGFPAAHGACGFPGQVWGMPDAVVDWLAQAAGV